jgi:hypothetical protein
LHFLTCVIKWMEDLTINNLFGIKESVIFNYVLKKDWIGNNNLISKIILGSFPSLGQYS